MLGGALTYPSPLLAHLPIALTAQVGATAGSVSTGPGDVGLWQVSALLSLGFATGTDDLAWSPGPAVTFGILHVAGTPDDIAPVQGRAGIAPSVALGGLASIRWRAAGPLYASFSDFIGGALVCTRAMSEGQVLVDDSGARGRLSLGLGLNL